MVDETENTGCPAISKANSLVNGEGLAAPQDLEERTSVAAETNRVMSQ
jgi:hypothetical protein